MQHRFNSEMKKWTVMLLILGGMAWFLMRTTRTNSLETPEFEPIRDDALAGKYAPAIVSPEEFGQPDALYYRAARSNGKLYITYHFVWAGESNPAAGFLPWLNRNVYTGGLRLQKTMFGKGDVEMISLAIDSAGNLDEVIYETAENHDPSDFGVKHSTVRTVAKPPLVFRVVSWNHLFVLEESGTGRRLQPEYFSASLWDEYEMVKEKETILKRSRAHQPYERRAAM